MLEKEEDDRFELKEGVEKGGIKYWYKDGKLHGSPAVEFPDGDYMCFEKGEFHCLSGPAVKINEREYYYLYGVEYSKPRYDMTVAQIIIGTTVKPDMFRTIIM